jgi:hypothetical protein
MCAWAVTDSITVQIAGKPATFPWRTPVDAESKFVRMRIEADPRLAAAAGGAARYFADAAGLEGPAITGWQTAVVEACKEAFANLTREHPRLDVSFTRLADRLEVSLSQEGETAPAVGFDSLIGSAPRVADASGKTQSGSPVLRGVDRVQYESKDGTAVTRLTKYIAPTTPRC